MKISRGIALASLLALSATPVFAQFSLGDAAMHAEHQKHMLAMQQMAAGLSGIVSGLQQGIEQLAGSAVEALVALATDDPSPVVRRAVASAAQRVPRRRSGCRSRRTARRSGRPDPRCRQHRIDQRHGEHRRVRPRGIQPALMAHDAEHAVGDAVALDRVAGADLGIDGAGGAAQPTAAEGFARVLGWDRLVRSYRRRNASLRSRKRKAR